MRARVVVATDAGARARRALPGPWRKSQPSRPDRDRFPDSSPKSRVEAAWRSWLVHAGGSAPHSGHFCVGESPVIEYAQRTQTGYSASRNARSTKGLHVRRPNQAATARQSKSPTGSPAILITCSRLTKLPLGSHWAANMGANEQIAGSGANARASQPLDRYALYFGS